MPVAAASLRRLPSGSCTPTMSAPARRTARAIWAKSTCTPPYQTLNVITVSSRSAWLASAGGAA
jgi:hypothetical protein